MLYDFNRKIDRKNTHSYKWSAMKTIYGCDDLLPMWVADMDFEAPSSVVDILAKRTRHGVFGYTMLQIHYMRQ